MESYQKKSIDILVIYVTRKMGDGKGGMEKVSADLCNALCKLTKVKIISVPDAISGNPASVLLLFFKLLFYLITNSESKRRRIIYLQDCMLSPLVILGKIFTIPAVIQAHGLDVIYCNWLYQNLIVPLIRSADVVTCVSEATRDECVRRGVSKERIVVIPNGVSIKNWNNNLVNHNEIPLNFREILSGRYILSVGRLVKRKGFDWFLSDVFARLTSRYPDLRYVIIGDGPMRRHIENLAKEKNLANRVFLLGKVDAKILAYAYANASIMVTPNLKLRCDFEGFGVVNIEASLFGVPIIASRVDGIPQSVVEGVTGILIEPGNVDEWAYAIISMLEDPAWQNRERIRSEVIMRYDWINIANEYARVFSNMIEYEINKHRPD